MVGGGARRVKAALALALVTGCFWRSYGHLMAAHVDVLVGEAHKGVDLVVGGRLAAESMPELTYPLERAEAFARDAATRAPHDLGSLAAFQTLIAHYRALIDLLDQVRRQHRGEAARAALTASLAAVDQAGEAVRAALRAEGRL